MQVHATADIPHGNVMALGAAGVSLALICCCCGAASIVLLLGCWHAAKQRTRHTNVNFQAYQLVAAAPPLEERHHRSL